MSQDKKENYFCINFIQLKNDSINQLPEKFIERMQHILGAAGEQMIKAIGQPAVTAVRLNPTKDYGNRLPKAEEVCWHPNAFFLFERPTFVTDPVFHAGGYYVQEASSMFIDYIVKFLAKNKPLTTFADLCAAPGGKSTILADNLPANGILLCNEIIHTRNNILRENLAKWGITQAIVTQQNIAEIAELGALFDLVLVDAPCSGEGLFRRSIAAAGEWSEENVYKCALRQKDILADAVRLLKPNGYLIYSTCTFEPEENIAQIVQLQTNTALKSIAIPILNNDMAANITIIEKENAIGYSFYPHKTKGEGFFCSVLQLDETEPYFIKPKKNTAVKATTAELALISRFVDLQQLTVYKFGQNFYALNDALSAFYPFVQSLHIKSIGVKLGEIKGKDFIPSQELSLSPILHPAIQTVAVDEQAALKFLKTESIQITGEPGWAVVCYQNYKLGWVKILNDRCNNYFPKEWKIRKEISQ